MRILPVTLSALMLSAVLAPAALAAPAASPAKAPAVVPAAQSAQMSAASLVAVPEFAAFNAFTVNIINGRFTADGIGRKSGVATNYEQFKSDGTLLRDQWGSDASGNTQTVAVMNRATMETCLRKGRGYSTSGDIRNDRKSKWSCDKGLLTAGVAELGMLMPAQAVTVLEGENPGLMFAWEQPDLAAPSNSMKVYMYYNGASVGSLYFFKDAPSGGYSYAFESGATTVNYKVVPTLSGNLVPWSKMKKSWKDIPQVS